VENSLVEEVEDVVVGVDVDMDELVEEVVGVDVEEEAGEDVKVVSVLVRDSVVVENVVREKLESDWEI
jgi:endonuclease V-like protein UPF0215 family